MVCIHVGGREVLIYSWLQGCANLPSVLIQPEETLTTWTPTGHTTDPL